MHVRLPGLTELSIKETVEAVRIYMGWLLPPRPTCFMLQVCLISIYGVYPGDLSTVLGTFPVGTVRKEFERQKEAKKGKKKKEKQEC